MKKFLATLLAIGMLATLSVQVAFAETVETGGDCTIGDFVDKDGAPNNPYFTNDYYTVSPASLTSTSKSYIEKVYISDDDGMVHIKIKNALSITEAKDIRGKITVTDKDTKSRYTRTFDAGDLQINPPVEIRMEAINSKEFTLPSGYNNGKIKFVTVDNEKIGTLYATLRDPDDFDVIGYYQVRVIEETTKFMNHNTKANMTTIKKYETANLEFLTWPSAPTFNATGTMGIVMDSDEYLYQVNADNTLSAVSGKYNSDRETFDFTTKTLGSYAISDRKITGAGTAASTASSVAPPPASSKPTPPPASSSKPAAPASSSAPAPAPAPSSSSVAPESSSAPVESSSEPTAIAPESSKPESSKPDSSSTAAEPEKDKGGFPVLPVVIGVGVVLVGGVAAYMILGKKKNSSKNYDSWDD